MIPTSRSGLYILLSLSIFVWAPTLYPGFWQGLDGFLPVWETADSASYLFAAQSDDLWRSVGDGAFWLPRLLALVFTADLAVRIAFAVALLVGGVAIYFWLQPRYGDRPATLAGLIYMLLPPILATAYVRSSLADLTIVTLLALSLACIGQNAARSESVFLRFQPMLLILAVLWMWQTQAGLALFATLVTTIYAGWVERNRSALVALMMGGGVGVLSQLWGKGLANGQAEVPVHFADHFVYLFQLLRNQWQVAPSIAGWQDGFPLQWGWVALSLAIVALWSWWQATDVQLSRTMSRQALFSLIILVGCSLATLTVAAPLWLNTGLDRLLTWPWQIMLLATPFLAFLAGWLLFLLPELAATPLWAALLTLVLAGSYPYLTTRYTQILPADQPVAVWGEQQLAVLFTDFQPPDATNSAQLQIGWQVLQPLAFDYSIFFQALHGTGDSLQFAGKMDVQPLGEAEPASSWQPGDIFTTTYSLAISTTVPLTELQYHFGFYDWRDGKRLPVTFQGGADDKLIFYGR